MKTVTISQDEATRVLHLLRSIQMNLSEIESAAGANAEIDPYLASAQFAGEINQAINELEGSTHESEIIEVPGSAQSNAAQQALEEFQKHFIAWVNQDEGRERFQAEVNSLVLLARLAEREAIRRTRGPEPSAN